MVSEQYAYTPDAFLLLRNCRARATMSLLYLTMPATQTWSGTQTSMYETETSTYLVVFHDCVAITSYREKTSTELWITYADAYVKLLI